MRRELDSLSLVLFFCLSLMHTWMQTHSSPHTLIPVKRTQRAARWHSEQSGGGLDKNTLFCKTLSSSLLWISRLTFHTVHDVDCSYNRKQGEVGGGRKEKQHVRARVCQKAISSVSASPPADH